MAYLKCYFLIKMMITEIYNAPSFLFALLHSAWRYGASAHKQKMIILYGWIPERPKGADCKSVAIASMVRIHLLPPQIVRNLEKSRFRTIFYAFFCLNQEKCRILFPLGLKKKYRGLQSFYALMNACHIDCPCDAVGKKRARCFCSYFLLSFIRSTTSALENLLLNQQSFLLFLLLTCLT